MTRPRVGAAIEPASTSKASDLLGRGPFSLKDQIHRWSSPSAGRGVRRHSRTVRCAGRRRHVSRCARRRPALRGRGGEHHRDQYPSTMPVHESSPHCSARMPLYGFTARKRPTDGYVAPPAVVNAAQFKLYQPRLTFPAPVTRPASGGLNEVPDRCSGRTRSWLNPLFRGCLAAFDDCCQQGIADASISRHAKHHSGSWPVPRQRARTRTTALAR